MSNGHGWEGIRQVCAMLLGARHVPERLCGDSVYLGRYNNARPLPFLPLRVTRWCSGCGAGLVIERSHVRLAGSLGQLSFPSLRGR